MKLIKKLFLLVIVGAFCSSFSVVDEVAVSQLQSTNNSTYPPGEGSNPILIGQNVSSNFNFTDSKNNVAIYQRGYVYEIYYTLTVARAMNLKFQIVRVPEQYNMGTWIVLYYKNGGYEYIKYVPELNIVVDTNLSQIAIKGENPLNSSGQSVGGYFYMNMSGTVK